MAKFSRRDFIKATAGIAAGSAVSGSSLFSPEANAARPLYFKPEKGAKLKLLRSSPFIVSEDNAFMINVNRFSQIYQIEVEVEKQPLGKLPAMAVDIAKAGEGPDVMISNVESHHIFPDKVLDVTDIGEDLGKRYGWYPVCEKYGKLNGRWIALPMAVSGTCMVYRDSWVKEAGFEKFPTTFDDFMKLTKALKKNNHPIGLALGNAPGDGNSWVHCILWGFGGKMVNTKDELVLNSPETVAALEYAKELYQNSIPGTLTWDDASNNKAFLAEQISVTNNAVSIYVGARREGKLFNTDVKHAPYPVGPVGRPTERQSLYPIFTYKHTKYPNACKEFMRFMLEDSQYGQWIASSRANVSPTLKSHENNPVWASDPEYRLFSRLTERMLWVGYEGKLGYAAAASLNDYIIMKMFGDVASGKTPKEAIAAAEERGRKYYKG